MMEGEKIRYSKDDQRVGEDKTDRVTDCYLKRMLMNMIS